ncbi:MAG: hypothetical protein QOE70_3668 [Chthoniobacter sp.]|jgi:hypothetical protein|nr:hypothetical protein [Chthoniobacter sp.]
MNVGALLKKFATLTGARPAGPPRFSELAERYAARLTSLPPRKAGGGPKVGVLVMPWLFTPVPFFSMECALMLAESGAEVVLVWDSSNVFLNAAKQREVDAVRRVVDRMASSFRVLDVAAVDGKAVGDPRFIDLLLFENAVRQLKGEENARQFLAEHPEIVAAMHAHAGRIETMLAAERFDWLLIPGGVWAASGLYTHLAKQGGVSFTTYDSGVGCLFIAHDGAAAHFGDIPRAFAALDAAITGEERTGIVAAAHAELQRRMEGLDVFRLQPKPAGMTGDVGAQCDIVVPLNYRSDSAALARQRVFGSVTDWLTQLLEWAADRGDVRVAVRQHPCERIPEYRGTDDWNRILGPLLARSDKLRFIAAEDPVNTYDLIANAAVVLPYTSRVGIEAGMLGKPVILATHCYYDAFGFVQNAASAEDYFALIAQALQGGLRPNDRRREEAALVYYLAERCLGLKTHFTPQPPDFLAWVETPRAQIWAEPANADLREALLTRQPAAWIQHRRFARHE